LLVGPASSLLGVHMKVEILGTERRRWDSIDCKIASLAVFVLVERNEDSCGDGPAPSDAPSPARYRRTKTIRSALVNQAVSENPIEEFATSGGRTLQADCGLSWQFSGGLARRLYTQITLGVRQSCED